MTGVGAVTPLGVGARATFDRWVEGNSGIEDGLAPADQFDPTDFLSKKEARRTDRFTQLAIGAAEEAISQAGLDGDSDFDHERVACIIATGVGGIGTVERNHDTLRDKGEKGVSALAIPMLMPNAGAGTVALRYGLQGPSHTVASACAAGADAISAGARLIRCGEADAVVTGGSEEGNGAARAIRRALDDAGIEPADVAYVNAHGTSTPFNDRAETLAIKKALGEEAGSIPVSSTKSVIGHLLGAAGAVEAIVTLHALSEGVAPPTVGWEEQDEDMDLDYVPESRPLDRGNGNGKIGLSDAFGFGGHNAVLCLRAAA